MDIPDYVPSPFDDVRIPDFVGEVSGWRAWQLVGGKLHPRLMSVTATDFRVDHVDAIWPTNRWFTAKCPHGHGRKVDPLTGQHVEVKHEIPVEGCKCGIYAARDRDHLIRLGYGVYGDNDAKVIGEVAFAGKVIPGEQGYRAEKARIKSLIVPYEMWQIVDPLAAAYKVPVEVGFLFSPAYRRR